ncbi:MAG: helix-turn-helix transcriptional regulator [Veillonellales bacterium]
MENKLGRFIREKRGNESLRDLAKRCGVSHTLIDTLEKGYDPRTHKPARPTVDSLKKISLGLGVHVLELLLLAIEEEYPEYSSIYMRRENSPNLWHEDPELLQIARKLKKLSPQKRKALEILTETDESPDEIKK